MSRSVIKSLGFAIGAACALVTATPALACNPFELLFGGCRDTQVYREAPAISAPEMSASAPQDRAAKSKAARLPGASSNGVSGKQVAMVATPAAPVGSMALFQQDKTLRAGDVIVTNSGFRIYKGAGAFTAVANDGSQLAELQKASFERKADGSIISQAPAKVEPVQTAAAPAVAPTVQGPTTIGLRSQSRARLSAREMPAGV